MKRLNMIAAATASTLAITPASLAQPSHDQACPRGQETCVRQDKAQNRHAEPTRDRAGDAPARKADARQHTPRPGDNGNKGRPFVRASNSRFPSPPAGQEYRIVNEHLVLVDHETMQIAKVLGVLSALTD